MKSSSSDSESSSPITPAETQRLLSVRGLDWWRSWNAEPLVAACAGVPDEALSTWPDVARWRALAALMQEGADALSCLELAHSGHLAQGDALAAGVDAHMALAMCLIDVGAMDRLNDWLARAGAAPLPDALGDDSSAFWLRLGILARSVLGTDAPPSAAEATQWLHAQLRPLRAFLSPDERLIAAQVLCNLHFAQQQYEQFDFIATSVCQPALFDAASPLMRGRWLHTVGFAHYQIGNLEQAEDAWQRGLVLAGSHALPQTQLLTSLAILRLLLDRGRLEEAERIEAGVRPQWGAGRVAQLIQLQQMRARLQLLREQPVRALATLRGALILADEACLSAPERASSLTDLAQVLIANGQFGEAGELLELLAREHSGREADVFCCLLNLFRAWRGHADDEAATRAQLATGFRRARGVRYIMFFRLLPRLAAQVCALALRWDIEPLFVAEAIRSRVLPAPPDADARWPWVVWVRLLGGFELRLNGELKLRKGKLPQKPLELLRALACQRTLMLSATTAADALWAEADGASARKSLEMAVQRLRRLLGDDSLVCVNDGRVWLDPTRVSSDVALRSGLVERLEALAMHSRARASADGQYDCNNCNEITARIVELTVGPLLPGAPDAPWLEAERDHGAREMARATRAAEAVLSRAGALSGAPAMLVATLRELSAR